MIEPINACDELFGSPIDHVREIPDDGGNQQGKDHRIAGATAHLKDQFDGQQCDHRVSDRPTGGQHAKEVKRAGPHDRHQGWQAMGVDDGGDRVGRIVEAVDELEAKRNQQRDTE